MRHSLISANSAFDPDREVRWKASCLASFWPAGERRCPCPVQLKFPSPHRSSMTLGRGSWPGFGRETVNDFFHEGVPGAFVAGLDHALGPDLGGAQPAHGTAGLGRAPLMALA
jgi:hypothetical protein